MAKRRAKKKGSKRATRAKTRRQPPGPKMVELSPVRRAVQNKIKELRKLEQTPRVSEAIGRMEECLAQVTQMCGDHMIFPI
jgi:hypothetical protein